MAVVAAPSISAMSHPTIWKKNMINEALSYMSAGSKKIVFVEPLMIKYVDLW